MIIQLLLLLLLPAVVFAEPGRNAPSGIQTLIDEPWNAFDAKANAQSNGWFNNYVGCNGFIIEDSTAPESPPNVYRAARAAGSAHGGCSITKTYQPVTRVYGRIRMRPSNPYYGVATGGTKITGYIQHTRGNHIRIDMERAIPGSAWQLSVGFNGPVANCHLQGHPGFINPRPEECNLVYQWMGNTGQKKNVQAGQWNDIEWIFETGTCPTCRNGKVIVWNDNIRVIDWRNVNLPNDLFSGWTVTHTWDGQPMENINVASHLDFDQMYLATYTGAAGGETGPPVDNAPGPPTDVTVTVR